MVVDAFKSMIFWILTGEGTGRPSNLALCLKILTPKQKLQRSPKALAQGKPGNISGTLLNGIPQIIYFLYGAK